MVCANVLRRRRKKRERRFRWGLGRRGKTMRKGLQRMARRVEGRKERGTTPGKARWSKVGARGWGSIGRDLVTKAAMWVG